MNYEHGIYFVSVMKETLRSYFGFWAFIMKIKVLRFKIIAL